MIGLGTLVNAAVIIVGGAAGLVLKRVLSTKITDTITHAIGLAVIIVGISGTLSNAFYIADGRIHTQFTLLMIISLAVGSLIGELINIEARLDSFAKFCEKKFTPKDDSSTFSKGFITATLIFCVGAMAIVGSIEDGINQNADILFAKSALDAVVAMVLASVLGFGVLFSAAVVLLYQGAITLFAAYIAPFLGAELISQMSLVGSVLIIGIGLNMLKITNIRLGNMLPAIFVPVAYGVVRMVLGW